MILKSRYCILEQLGKGGEGHLYLARDLELGVFWAVKEIPRKKRSEAKLLRLLDHPALPKMIDYLEKEEYCYLIMEYIQGKSLAEWITAGRCFSAQELLDMGIRISEVICYLHGLQPQVFYGDMKPDNLMLTDSGNLYLVDLGSAVFAYDGMGRSNAGTHGFAAPEQYNGEIRENTDVFGFGKTMQALAVKTRKKEWIRNWQVFWIFFRCGMQLPAFRYENMEAVHKKLVEIYRGRKKITLDRVGMLFLAVLLSAGIFQIWDREQMPFTEVLSEVMEPVYGERFSESSKEEQENILERTREGLLAMTKKYTGREESRKLSLMLAINEELLGEMEGAALQYEQLLFYDRGFRQGYGEYGCFLQRVNQEKAAEKLWNNYLEREKNGELERGDSYNLSVWQAIQGETEPFEIPQKSLMELNFGGFDLSVGTGEADGWWNQGDVWTEDVETERTEPPIREEIQVPEPLPVPTKIPESVPEPMEAVTQKPMPEPTKAATQTPAPKPTKAAVMQTPVPEPTKQAVIQTSAPKPTKTVVVQQDAAESTGVLSNVPTPKPAKMVKKILTSRTSQTVIQSLAPKPTKTVTQSLTPKPTKTMIPTSSPEPTKEETLSPPFTSMADLSLEEVAETSGKPENKRKSTKILPVYFSIEQKTSVSEVQVQEYILETGNQELVQIRVEAEGPVHLWTAKMGQKECIWRFAESGYLVETEKEETFLHVLLVYGEKMGQPSLFLT